MRLPFKHSRLHRLAVVGVALLVASCRPAGVLDPRGPIASAERLLLINSTATMLVVVVPVIAATLGFAWWYRASNPRAVRSLDVAYEGRIEFVTWSIPALIVILLGGVTWIGSHQLDPRAPIAAVNRLVVPAGTPVQFRLTSATVMNSFFVPQLGSQIYTMAGMTTHLNLLADKPGDYPGLSANFSGDGFSDMRFLVHVVPASEFSSWRTRATDEGAVLNADAYLQLARAAGNTQIQTYRSVDPNLFDRIVQQNGAAEPAAS